MSDELPDDWKCTNLGSVRLYHHLEDGEWRVRLVAHDEYFGGQDMNRLFWIESPEEPDQMFSELGEYSAREQALQDAIEWGGGE